MSETTTEEALAPTGDSPVDAVFPCVGGRAGNGILPARVVAELGRAGLVWFALAVVYAGRHPMTDRAIVAMSVAASVFVVALKAASSPGILVFGRGLSRALGVAPGLGAVAVLNGTPIGLHLGWTGWRLRRSECGRRRRSGTSASIRSSRRGSGSSWWASTAPSVSPEDVRRCMQAGFEILGDCRGPACGRHKRPVGMDELERLIAAQHPDVVVLADERTFGEAVDRLLAARPGFAWRAFPGSASASSVGCPSSPSARRGSCAWWTCVGTTTRGPRSVYSTSSRLRRTRARGAVARRDGAPREDDARAGALPPDARRGGRSMLHRPEDPDHAMRRRGDGRVVHVRRRPTRDARRTHPATNPSRRAPPALERAEGRHVDGRAPAGATRVHPDDRGRRSLLEPAPPRQAGCHRLGADPRRLRLRLRRHGAQALVRPLVPPPRQRPRGPRDLPRDDRRAVPGAPAVAFAACGAGKEGIGR